MFPRVNFATYMFPNGSANVLLMDFPGDSADLDESKSECRKGGGSYISKQEHEAEDFRGVFVVDSTLSGVETAAKTLAESFIYECCHSQGQVNKWEAAARRLVSFLAWLNSTYLVYL